MKFKLNPLEQSIRKLLISIACGATSKITDDESPYLYSFSEASGFEILKEKVVIDWGKAALSWHQHFANGEQVIRIDERMEDTDGIPHFKSYADMNLSYENLLKITTQGIEEWEVALQAVNCIYIITDHTNGKHYIGSTYDKRGMWMHWSGYAATGHNDNLVRLAIRDFERFVEGQKN